MDHTIETCVFPAAGYGTRFLPATKASPKEMLPIVTKPLIQYGVEEAMQAGLRNIVFITGRGKRALEDHFDISYELEHQIHGTSKEKALTELRKTIRECSISYTRQNEMKGLGHAIYCANHMVKEPAFAVVLADDLCYNNGDGVLKQMTDLYHKYKCSVIAIMEVSPEETSSYGIIEGEEIEEGIYQVKNMVEKPDPGKSPSNLAIIGRYILSSEIFELIHNTPPGKNGEIQLTDALMQLAGRGEVIAYKFKGHRYDCGSVDGFVQATNDFYERFKNNHNA